MHVPVTLLHTFFNSKSTALSASRLANMTLPTHRSSRCTRAIFTDPLPLEQSSGRGKLTNKIACFFSSHVRIFSGIFRSIFTCIFTINTQIIISETVWLSEALCTGPRCCSSWPARLNSLEALCLNTLTLSLIFWIPQVKSLHISLTLPSPLFQSLVLKLMFLQPMNPSIKPFQLLWGLYSVLLLLWHWLLTLLISTATEARSNFKSSDLRSNFFLCGIINRKS